MGPAVVNIEISSSIFKELRWNILFHLFYFCDVGFVGFKYVLKVLICNLMRMSAIM